MKIIERAFRVYCRPDELDARVAFYEALQSTRCERRFAIPETEVVGAKVGGFLILAAAEERLAAVRHVSAIFYVEGLDAMLGWLATQGTDRLNGPRVVTGGRNATVRHADGLVAEYFEAGA